MEFFLLFADVLLACVMSYKFSDANKGTRVFFTKIKPMNSRLTNEISMQHGRLYLRKTLESG